ncbi:MAG TPA: NrsF family protein [Polyangiaceae bacterium]|jgi:hypothetical protein
MSELPSDPKARLLEAMRRTPSTTRQTARAWAWLVLPSGIIVAGALYFTMNGLDHGGGRPVWFYVACAASWTAVAATSMWGALGRARSRSWRSRSTLLAVAAGTPGLLFALMFAFAIIDPEVTALHPERLGLKCFGLTLAAAVLPLVALLYARRESDPVHPAVTGAALGSACGASAGIMVELWCPVATPAHVALGHILPIGVLAALGAVLGARILKMSGRRRP